ncbi:long distal fiber subunit [Acinetobacter phage Minot]|nr:long distal fiber subunit [Acinetobacter phage Minot]QQO96691.1 long distal tail fiber subunit [Acinetobacter phage Mokit]
MALDPNINRIKHLRSSTAGAVPAPSLLDEGEIAVNLVDRTIFSKNGANVVELGFGKGGTVTGPINVTGGNAVSASQFNGALNGNAATASRLLTGRKINDVVFDGTRDITIEDSTKLYKENVLTESGDSRVIRDVATIRAMGTVNGALIIHLPKAARNASTMMKIIVQGFDYSSGLSSQGPWSVNLTGYNYSGPTWHSYQAVSTGSKAPFEHVRYGQAADHNVIILGGTSGDASIPTSSWTYYNISIEKIYLTAGNTTLYNNPADPIYLTIEDSLTPYSVQVTLPLEGVNMAESLRTKRTFTFTGDATGSLAFDGTANVSTALTINSATTGQAGLVKLNNTLTSTSVTEALTAAQGKALQDTKVNRSGDTISGRLVVTQGITTPSISNDVTVPISFLGPSVNNSNAGGIRVRNLEVNNQYGAATRAFGIFSKEGIIAGDSASYASLADIGTGNNIPFKVNNTNVVTTYGFVPFLGGNVQSSLGYMNVVSIGVYRPDPRWDNSGMYMSIGANDNYSTEAFLFKNGRTIENTNGPIILKGNADSATKLQTPRTINGVAFDGTSNIRIQQLAEGIPANADLNTYLTEGFYYCDTNAVAQTIKNGPFTGGAFCLLVERTAGVKQTFTIYSPSSSRTWIRNIYGGTTGAWREVAYTDAPTFTGAGRFTGALTVNGITNTTGLNNSGDLRSSGSSYLGNQTELGTIGTASQVYIDFHSGASNIDYDARIMSSGGTTAIGNGALSYIAASHTFNGSIGAGTISAASISVSTGLGIANTSNTVLAGLSLYGGAQSGKPNYGITFAGTGNAGTGKHGDLDNASWAVYLTCATAGAEKRGWIFQRSDNNTNVASISTNGVLSTNGNIQTLNDNTMINVGNDKDLALVKKRGSKGFIGVGADTPFSVSKSNANWVDPTHTFTELFTVSSAGVANAVGGFTGTFSGTFNGTISGTLTGSLNGNASTATTLQTARAIGITGSGASGSVSFDGSGNVNIPLSVATQATATNNTTIATTAFVQNVNVAETGAAAYALRLKTPRTFQVTGGITTNAVAFDGQQNVTLTANAVDGSKVSGVVPEAVKAQTVMVNGQPGARLAAMWSGTTWNRNFTRDAVYSSASSITIEIGDSGDGANDDRMNNIKVGSLLHLIFAVSTGGIWSGQLSTGTITAVSINRSTKSIILTVNIPHNISPGSKTSARILGITYSSIGCKYVGCVTLFAKGDIGGSEFSQVLQLDAPVNNAVMTTSVSGDVSRYHNLFPYGAFLSHRNAVSMSATMVNNTMANFICTDNDNDVPASVGMANIQIWDVV